MPAAEAGLFELAGRVVVVTGASSGIGRATAWAIGRKGAIVVPAARRQERLEELAERIRTRGGEALPIACDVSKRRSIEGMRDRVLEEYGRCDALVNNAGIPGGGPFTKISVTRMEKVVRTNYLGVLWATKAFLPTMLEQRRGHVVNVASLAGRYAIPFSAVYGSTKHAVVAFSESLNYETSPQGVLVTSVNPGFVSTELFPHSDAVGAGGWRSRMVMPAERVAATIVRVLERGIAPEISVPRWLASFQALRVLTPPLFRAGVRRAAAAGLRSTRPGEGRG